MDASANPNSVNPIVEQKIQIPYSYVAGPAVSRFLTGLRERVFHASQCGACGRKTVPPLSFCGRCWKPIAQFVPVGPLGVLESFAAAPDMNNSTALYALIRLKGADTCLPHLLELEPGQEAQIGAEVEPDWKEERQGSVLDIRCFRLTPIR
jgi:uncharacterized OB-fold protein